ncbi:MAG: flagellar M-ring protein FliF [Deltaproteobacteria bacterium]|nr:MAG: flagellar M-ring protein FliF [Deltaproteobacteria bacterium]
MEAVSQRLKAVAERWAELKPPVRRALALGLAATVIAVVAGLLFASRTERYEYAFTGLDKADAEEAVSILRSAGIHYRVEAGGEALAVEASRVYDARLALAAAGIPRKSGTGFELFDKADLSQSEFTQQVNLRRAIEGELARTIGSLDAVREARVHLTFPRRGLFQEDDDEASASVVVRLFPGSTLSRRQLAGIRHLVASAVPGLKTESVTVVDASGRVLAGDEAGETGDLVKWQRRLEQRIEERIVSLLEPVVGEGAVVARVTAEVDASQVQTTEQLFDPEKVAVKSERVTTRSETGATSNAKAIGIPGATSNDPARSPGGGATRSGARQTKSEQEDETRNYEVSNTVRRIVRREPKLERLTVAVLVDGVDGKPRSEAEVARITELVKRAAGFDASRGDEIEVTSMPFAARRGEGDAAEAPATPPWLWYAAAGGGLLLAVLLGLFVLRRRRQEEEPALTPGRSVAEIEARFRTVEAAESPPAEEAEALPDPMESALERARELTAADPLRAARLLRAWIKNDREERTEMSHA